MDPADFGTGFKGFGPNSTPPRGLPTPRSRTPRGVRPRAIAYHHLLGLNVPSAPAASEPVQVEAVTRKRQRGRSQETVYTELPFPRGYHLTFSGHVEVELSNERGTSLLC